MLQNDYIDLRLRNNNGYAWNHKSIDNGDIWIKGFLIINDLVLSKDKFLDYISDLPYEKLLSLLTDADGQYIIIINKADNLVVVEDHIRSFPVLYWTENKKIVVSDLLTKENFKNKKIDDTQRKFFLNMLFTFDNKTLFNNVFQVPAGHVLNIDKNKITLLEYWRFHYNDEQIENMETAVARILEGYDSLFAKCVRLIGNRKVVIPLSGGYDSRLILFGLWKAGIEKNNIITFTYGTNTEDVQLSHEIAEKFGVLHYFVPYDTDLARQFYINNIESFSLYAANGISTPCIQEWYAVNKLAEENIITKDSVIVPGYGGVLPGHYMREDLISENQNFEEIIKKYLLKMILGNAPGKHFAERSKLADTILQSRYFDLSTQKKAVESFERFIYSEEQAKFIMNAVRDYEIMNCEWITPFFFKEQFELWAAIDNKLRNNNLAYRKAMQNYFSEAMSQIRFTGSKITRSKSKKIINYLQGKINLFLNRKRVHYLFSLIPYNIYFRYAIRKIEASCNNIVAQEYLRKIYNKDE